MIFSDALDGYWLERRRNLSKKTIEQYEYYFNYLIEFTGDVELDQLNSNTIRSWLNWLADTKNLSAKTCSNGWVTLSSFFTWAEKEIDLPHPIRDRIACPVVAKPGIQYYSQTDILAMLQACEHGAVWTSRAGNSARSIRPTANRDRAIITTLLDTGLRASELCQLKIEDYDKDAGKIIVRKGKGNKFRVVYVGQSARRHIWRYMTTRKGRIPLSPLFSTGKSGQENHLDINNLRCTIKRIAKRAGVDGVNLHRFRHTFAINFLRNGGSPLELKELLGHSKLETVLIYVRLAEVDLARAQQVASPADKWGL